MKFRLRFPGFITTIFRVFAIEENQEALLTSGQESNSPQKDNNDEENPGLNINTHTSILPTDPAFHQPAGASGLKVLELDHESLRSVPNKLRISRVIDLQCNESSCSEQPEQISDCGSDSESTSSKEWELIPDYGHSDSESTSSEHWELIPSYDHTSSESTSSEHWEIIPGYDHGHSDSERSSGESWEVLADYHSDSEDYVCVKSICGDPWQMLQQPLQGSETQPKQGTVSRFLLLVNEILILSIILRVWYLCVYLLLLSKGIISLVTGKGINRVSNAYQVPSMEGLEAGRFCACQSNVITNFCTANSGSCVHGGAAVPHSLHVNIGQNTNTGNEQTVGDVTYEEGYVQLQVNGARDVFINGQIYLNVLSQAS